MWDGSVSILVLASLLKASLVAQVDPYVLMGVCHAESGLVATVSNWDDPNGGSHGLCQVALLTAKNLSGNRHIKPNDLYDPQLNAVLAAKLLKENYELNNGDKWKAISMYNVGSSRWYNEAYVGRVRNSMNKIKKMLCLDHLLRPLERPFKNDTNEHTFF